MEEYYHAPYIMVPAFLIAIFLLICLRQFLISTGKKQGVQIGNGQTIGNREEQDDYFSTVNNANGVLAVLADGIGGLSKGQLSSTIAVSTFIRQFEKATEMQNTGEFFTQTASLANKEILKSLKGVKGGTTLVAVIIAQGYLHWASVGDSAIAIFRHGEIININKKHIFESQLEERYLAGEITKDELLVNPMKNMITNHLGHEGFKNIEIGSEPVRLEKRDKVILFSNGVYNSLTEVELEKILSRKILPYDAAQDIIELINQKKLKDQDNATVVILEKGW